MGMQHSVEAALRADIQASISQDRNDLPRRQRREFRLVAGEQDPLALLVAQAMRHHAVAAFTAITSVPITGKLSPPALQGGEPHAQHSRHLTSPCTRRHAGIEDRQGLAPIRRRRQSSSPSPQ